MISFTGRRTGKNLDALVDATYGKYVKLPLFNGLHHIRAQHQISQIGSRYQNTLVSSHSFEAADIKETFDLSVNTANGLDLTILIHGSGYGDTLHDGDFRETGKNGVELSG